MTTDRGPKNGRELVTFRIEDMHLGLDISRIQEINREMFVTSVPNVPPTVRGVMNLRGEVVTVIDLKMVLRGRPSTIDLKSKSVIVRRDDERAALIIDSIGDVIACEAHEIEAVPSNVRAKDRRFFLGIKPLEKGLVIELDLDAVLADVFASVSEE